MTENPRTITAAVLLTLLVAGAAVMGGCAADEAPDITPQDAYTLIQQNRDNPDFIIIDVRSELEFTTGHIADAVNIDYYSETFTDEIDALDRDKTYLVYYSCNCERVTAKTLVAMAEMDFQEVYYIDGGMDDWIEAGLPTTR